MDLLILSSEDWCLPYPTKEVATSSPGGITGVDYNSQHDLRRATGKGTSLPARLGEEVRLNRKGSRFRYGTLLFWGRQHVTHWMTGSDSPYGTVYCK